MRLETEITMIYKKYSKEIRDAHSKILNLEKIYKSRASGDQVKIKESILKILEEAANDNK